MESFFSLITHIGRKEKMTLSLHAESELRQLDWVDQRVFVDSLLIIIRKKKTFQL